MASVPVAQAPVPELGTAEPMDVDSGPRGTKRSAEDGESEDGHKKARTGTFSVSPLLAWLCIYVIPEDAKPATTLKR